MSDGELWLLDLESSADALIAIEQRRPRLSPQEFAEAEAIGQHALARQRLARRMALRILLERSGGPGIAYVPISRAPAGKPQLADSQLSFSVAHSGALTLLALTCSGRIGVDLEQDRSMRLVQHRAEAIASAAGQLTSDSLPEGRLRTLQAWTRLEAAAKADGCGIGRLLTALGLVGRRQRPPLGLDSGRLAKEWLDSSGLTVSDVPMRPGLVAAVATEKGVSPFDCAEFPSSECAIEALLACTGRS